MSSKISLFSKKFLRSDEIICFDLIVIFLISFLVRFFILNTSDNYFGARPMIKLITSLKIITVPQFSENINFFQLPFYLYSVAFSTILGREQLMAGRFLSLFFGVLSVCAFYIYLRLICGREKAFCSALILAFYPPHVLISVLTMPFAILFFLVLCVLYFVKKKKVFIASMIAYLACGYDYFAWIFTAITALWLLLKNKPNMKYKISGVLIFLGMPAAFMLMWVFLYQKNLVDIFQLLYFTKTFKMPTALTIMKQMNMTMLKSVYYPVAGMYLFAILGALINTLKRKYELLFFCLCLIPVAAVQASLNSSIFDAFILLQILSIPLVVEGFFYTADYLKDNKNVIVRISLLIVLIFMFFVSLKERPTIPSEIKDIASWVGFNLKPDNKIYLAKDKDGYYPSISMLSGLPQGNFRFIDIDEINNGQSHIDKANSYLILKESDIKSVGQNQYTVAAKKGNLVVLKFYEG